MRSAQAQSVFMDYLPAVVSGFLLTLAFPKANCAWLAWVAMVPLLVWSAGSKKKKPVQGRKAFNAGLAFGMAHFLTLLYWIVNTVAVYGGLPWVAALSVLVLLCFYLSLFPALFLLLLTRFPMDSMLMPLRAAGLWVGLEYLRSSLFTGLPWGLAGYSQSMNTELIQVADVAGVYAVSFILVYSNAAVAGIWCMAAGSHKRWTGAVVKKQLFLMVSLVLILGSAWGYGKTSIAAVDRTMVRSGTKRVTLVQGNIPQDHKWDKAFKEATVKTYCDLSRKAAATGKEKPDLIVWPETALPFYYGWDKKFSSMVDACIKEVNTAFIIGSPAFEPRQTGNLFYNRAFLVNRAGGVTGTYDKIHLVPFGEYVPFGRYLSFLGKITAQAGNFTPGSRAAAPLVFKDARVGMLICFEIIFPSLARSAVGSGADFLVTITNDAWFGLTSAPYQHFSMAVFRAVENRRSVVRAANTGISGFIDPAGRVGKTTALGEKQILTGAIATLNQATFYTIAGDLFAFFCMGGIVAEQLLAFRTRRHFF
ncbi:MAG: apolipoprotein N-acyltransferase [Desulfobacteraceae bacterium]